MNNIDEMGNAVSNIVGGILGGVTGAALGYLLAKKLGLSGWKKAALITAATIGGAALGAFLGPYVAKLVKSIGSSAKSWIKSLKSTRCYSQCFVAGTLVLEQNGLKPIEKIQAGDYVYAEDPETGEKALKKVVQTFVNETNELVHIYVGGEEITTTPEHPFYVPQKGWVSAIQLRAGDILLQYNGDYLVVEQVQHEILEGSITVYNFEVQDFHTYYVSQQAMLVHNRCPWYSVRESSKAWNTVKNFNKTQMETYEKVLQKIARNETSGLNVHMLSTGEYAADIAGFGKGRGRARIIYNIVNGVIEVVEITLKHYKR